jgi:hypothetical protein
MVDLLLGMLMEELLVKLMVDQRLDFAKVK